jgi:hypothetical protein
VGPVSCPLGGRSCESFRWFAWLWFGRHDSAVTRSGGGSRGAAHRNTSSRCASAGAPAKTLCRRSPLLGCRCCGNCPLYFAVAFCMLAEALPLSLLCSSRYWWASLVLPRSPLNFTVEYCNEAYSTRWKIMSLCHHASP